MARLLSDTELNEIQKDYINVLTGSGESLLSLINDILDFAIMNRSTGFRINTSRYSEFFTNQLDYFLYHLKKGVILHHDA